jgi:hypothetical protein
MRSLVDLVDVDGIDRVLSLTTMQREGSPCLFYIFIIENKFHQTWFLFYFYLCEL